MWSLKCFVLRRLWNCSWLAVPLALLAAGCGRSRIERVEWPVMGTVAAVQVRIDRGVDVPSAVSRVKSAFEKVERLLNHRDAASEIRSLSSLSAQETLARCSDSVRSCYEAAFRLSEASGGAFNPRWRGDGTLDLGAIAKGFAIDAAADGFCPEEDVLIDLGGNLKSVRGGWKTGVKNPFGDGIVRVVDLKEGESLATSAVYYRGGHIRDGRTGHVVSNGVASVTVRCSSAMWADGLSTTLFILGPEEGREFLERSYSKLAVGGTVDVVWIMENGASIVYEKRPPG